MSLEQFTPQDFAPIQVKSADLDKFFTALPNRQVVRGNTTANFQVTNKPFEGHSLPQKPLGVLAKIPTIAGDITKTPKKRKTASTTKTAPKKKRTKIEAKLRKAKF